MSREQKNLARQLPTRTLRIASLNDALRRHGLGGMVGVTRGVANLPGFNAKELMSVLAAFDAFTPDNDPYGEHDFGKVSYAGAELFWKIDYYAAASGMTVASPDPANPDVTERLLTVMLTSDY
jgi:hypothetical protein